MIAQWRDRLSDEEVRSRDIQDFRFYELSQDRLTYDSFHRHTTFGYYPNDGQRDRLIYGDDHLTTIRKIRPDAEWRDRPLYGSRR